MHAGEFSAPETELVSLWRALYRPAPEQPSKALLNTEK